MPPRKKRTRPETPEETSSHGSAEHSDYLKGSSTSEHSTNNSEPSPPASPSKKRGGKESNTTPKKKKETVKKAVSPTKKAEGSTKKKVATTSKKRKREDSDDEEDDGDGFEVVGTIVPAPTTGRVPPGRISKNTLSFLKKLQDPKCNDREWFKLHDPVFRQAEKEWTDFVEEFTTVLTEVDDEIPHLPPKDVVHRIYRDVRFSNDKTPYKTNFSASFSRTGRKGMFSHSSRPYVSRLRIQESVIFIGPRRRSIKSGGSIFAAGVWCPGKNELEQIRTHIKRNPSQLREVISEQTFESLFGPAKWSKDKRQNIFGGEDQLKVAPKGVAKDHPDIDLLKCRSFAVVHRLTDEQVLDPGFTQILAALAQGAKPFAHRLNHMMTVGAGDDSDEDDEDAES